MDSAESEQIDIQVADSGFGHGKRSKNMTKLQESLASEQQDKDGNPLKKRTQPCSSVKRPRTKGLVPVSIGSDDDVGDFVGQDSSSSESTDIDYNCMPTDSEDLQLVSRPFSGDYTYFDVSKVSLRTLRTLRTSTGKH
ncbi:hypothetical protein BDQ17DRAFT_1339827 [Cyathus striatus]|nr:hypothetical protein BDQ17DRAFT_1339827 [Cyathus striatus]